MKQLWLTAAAIAGAAFITPPVAVADDGTRLFQDWHYGQHIDEFPRSQGYYDCSGDLGVLALCHDNIAFLQYQFHGQLLFADDNTLIRTNILADYSDDLYATVVGALVRSFALAFAEGPNDTFDMVEHVQQGTFDDEHSLSIALTEFESDQLRQGYFGMVMIEQDGLASMQGATSVQDLLLDLPEDVRAADVYVYEDEWGPLVEAAFYLPGRQRDRVFDKATQAPIEDF